ncbi:MAG: hypothetical protein JRE21_04935 [Deltaproteobacteria bacterium]|jgi:hypothetical protein|nr:hypothetical protein [Deltaproteobacteria bacterium]
MGKNSLIKSTTKKKPAAEKEDKTQKAQKASTRAKKAAAQKPDAKPVKKTVKAKGPAKKKPAVKAEATAQAKKTAPKAKAQTAVKHPPETSIHKKPEPKEAAFSAQAPASTDHMPPPAAKQADPAEKMLYFGIAGFALLVLIVVLASWMNSHRYYVKPGKGGVDIWQGKFAPKGARHLINFPGLHLAEPIKDSYSAKEVFPIIYQYYLDKADMLLEGPGVPDFDGVKKHLHQSQTYATTREMKELIKKRLDAINLMVLLYKADVAASKNSPEDLKAARGYLKEALSYRVDEVESTRIQQKAEAVDQRLAELNAASTKTAADEEDKKQP